MPKVDLYHGDCLDIMPTLDDDIVDAVITDPPFGINFDYAGGYSDDPDKYQELIKWIVKESNRIVRPGGMCFVFVAQLRLRHIWPFFPDDSRVFIACKNFVQFRPIPVQFSYDPVIYWKKTGTALIKSHAGKRDWYVGNTAKSITQKKIHPCRRPIDTMVYLVDNFSPPNGIIIDPFMGSGTTGVACVQTGRHFIGIELDPDYYAIAERRIDQTQPPLFVEKTPISQPEQYIIELSEEPYAES